MMDTDTVIPLADGSFWLVRALEFPDEVSAVIAWEEFSNERQGNYSLWHTVNPDGTRHSLVLCGHEEDLPEIEGGVPFKISYELASAFAMRRARSGADFFSGNRESTTFKQRYKHPVVIDPMTGETHPWIP